MKEILVFYINLVTARQGRLADWFQSISAMKDFYKISMMPELNLKNKNETREALKVLLATRIKNVVLICASNDLAEIMNEVIKKINIDFFIANIRFMHALITIRLCILKLSSHLHNTNTCVSPRIKGGKL